MKPVQLELKLNDNEFKKFRDGEPMKSNQSPNKKRMKILDQIIFRQYGKELLNKLKSRKKIEIFNKIMKKIKSMGKTGGGERTKKKRKKGKTKKGRKDKTKRSRAKTQKK